MIDGEASADHPFFDKIVGVLLTVILFIWNLMAIGWGDASVEPRMERFARETPGAILWWREDVGPILIIFIVLALAPMALVPGAFGVRYRRQLLPNLSPPWRAILVLGLAAAIGADGLAYRAFGGREIGVATIDGAEWLRGGRLRDQWLWEQATGITGGCRTGRSTLFSSPGYDLQYLVTFPGNRKARLSYGAWKVSSWSSIVEPIDDKLTAAGVKRVMKPDAECLAHFQTGMTDDDGARLRKILRGSGGYLPPIDQGSQ